MKKFIFKLAWFVLPFIASYFALYTFGSTQKGDLIRIGNLIDRTSNYRDIFNSDFKEKIYYTQLSDADEQSSFDVLTIGDSFSQQRGYGYQNYLSKNENLKVLHYNKSGNSLQILSKILKGDVLEKIEVKYVIIQFIERQFINNTNNIDSEKAITLNDFKESFTTSTFKSESPYLFSNGTLKFPLYNFLYLFDDNAFFSKVYKTELRDELFSVESSELLFYYEDVANIFLNNNINAVKNLNIRLNDLSSRLKKKDIKLIVLPSPDKYDAYYDYIKNKENYLRPLFFENMSKMEKQYMFIDTKKIVDDAIKNRTDIYFYDDTHWSPITSKLVAIEIKKAIDLNTKKNIPNEIN